ncbi:MAG: signal peptide peptidase SppA [Planctomycetaceae bacterium]|nr:signal peptide peptidase SppA [Planctomycetaceae bacterium]
MSDNSPDSPQPGPATPPPSAPPAQPPQQLPPRPHTPPPPARSGGCGAMFALFCFFLLGIVGICVLVGTVMILSVGTDVFGDLSSERLDNQVTEKMIGGNDKAENKIAVVSIEGVITSDSDGFIARQIRRVLADSKIKAVVLRVESPGGTMAGSDYYLHLLKKMKAEREIPIVVSMGSVATSGGYYVSMVGDEIFAEPSTITGSIGVIASLFDASELFKKIGIESTPIISGEHKAMGSFMKPMSDEERAIWQRLIDENFGRFKDVIVEGRRALLSPDEVNHLATGQIYTANEALHHKLVDHLGFLDEAVERAGDLADLLEQEYRVVQYMPKLSFFESMLESRVPNMLLPNRTLSEMTTPRVYLLCPYVVP